MIRVCSFLLCLASPVTADVVGTVRQMCQTEQGADWACGAFVRDEARRRYDGARAVCVVVDTDRYGRAVAKCSVDGQDIGEDIVLDGLATAYRRYSMDYDLAEKSAQVTGAGLWSGTMQLPAEFRAAQRAATATPPPGNCIIKGNISGSGQIYHQPHNRDYDRVRISEAKGERWFCTTAEAEAAGWRAARN